MAQIPASMFTVETTLPFQKNRVADRDLHSALSALWCGCRCRRGAWPVPGPPWSPGSSWSPPPPPPPPPRPGEHLGHPQPSLHTSSTLECQVGDAGAFRLISRSSPRTGHCGANPTFTVPPNFLIVIQTSDLKKWNHFFIANKSTILDPIWKISLTIWHVEVVVSQYRRIGPPFLQL